MKKTISMLLALAMCLTLCACGGGNDTPKTENIQSTNPASTQSNTNKAEPTNITIDITLDNWQEYFDFEMGLREAQNDFGELSCLWSSLKFAVKDEWKEKATTVDVVVEYSLSEGYWCVFTYNTDTGEFEVSNPENNEKIYTHTGTFTKDSIDNDLLGPTSVYLKTNPSTFTLSENVATIEGETFDKLEIVRIQGTLTISE